jgi:3-hydroxyacyl-CoA dehydrogenase
MSVKRVAVLGAGTMGHGIAQATAYAGIATSLYDPDSARSIRRGNGSARTSRRAYSAAR